MSSMDAVGTNNNSLTVGRVAQMAGVGVPTLRFYERAGLLPKPARTLSNYRVYSDDAAVKRIRFIRRAQQLGFTLKEIKEMLALRVGCAPTAIRFVCAPRRKSLTSRHAYSRFSR